MSEAGSESGEGWSEPVPGVDVNQAAEAAPLGSLPRAVDAGSSAGGVARAGVAVGVAAAATAVASFIKEVSVARRFGAGRDLDAYLVAYLIVAALPSIATFVIQSTFVPALVRHRKGRAIRAVSEFTLAAIVALTALLGIATAGIWVAGPRLLQLTAPGLSPAARSEAISLLTLLLPLLVATGVTSVLTAALNALKVFALPAATQVLPSLLTLVATLGLSGSLGIRALALGWVTGAFLQVIVLAGECWRRGLRPLPPSRAAWTGLVHFGRVSAPYVVVALMSVSLLLVDQHFASQLGAGGISALNYADKLFRLPLTVLITALYTSVHPYLADAAADRGSDQFVRLLRSQLTLAAVILLPAGLMLSLLNNNAVEFIYRRGAFGTDAVRSTASVLFFLGLNVPVLGVWFIYDRALTSLHRTRPLMVLAVAAMAFKFVASATLVHPLGVGGLALATVLTFIVGVTGMHLLLRFGTSRLRGLPVVRIAGLTVAALAIFGVARLILGPVALSQPSYARAALVSGCALVVYIAVVAASRRYLFAGVDVPDPSSELDRTFRNR